MTNSSLNNKDLAFSTKYRKPLIEVLGNNTDQRGDFEDKENLCGEPDQNIEDSCSNGR